MPVSIPGKFAQAYLRAVFANIGAPSFQEPVVRGVVHWGSTTLGPHICGRLGFKVQGVGFRF